MHVVCWSFNVSVVSIGLFFADGLFIGVGLHLWIVWSLARLVWMDSIGYISCISWISFTVAFWSWSWIIYFINWSWFIYVVCWSCIYGFHVALWSFGILVSKLEFSTLCQSISLYSRFKHFHIFLGCSSRTLNLCLSRILMFVFLEFTFTCIPELHIYAFPKFSYLIVVT